MAETQFVIWGSAGHAKVLASAISLLGGRVVATFDNDPKAQALHRVPLYIGMNGFEQWLVSQGTSHHIEGLVAIGGDRGNDRMSILNVFEGRGLQVNALVHPAASVCSTACIGPGSHVLAQAVIAAEARLGRGCIVNHRASVDHECLIGNGVHIAPGATLCGCITIGDSVMIGAGAVVLPRLSIGEGAVIGAGAVVTRNVAAGTVVAGNPARVIKGSSRV